MSRILLVDDDNLLTELLTEYLTAEGLDVHSVPDGEAGVQEILSAQYDVVVLDSMMPKMNGLDVLKTVRAQSKIPIIMLTAKGDDIDRIIGLECGADDYLPKPFRMEELIARARALVRRAGGRGNATQQIGRLTVDLNRMTAAIDGIPVAVTPLEFRLVSYLALNRDRSVAPTELLEHLYGDDDSREANAVEAVITRLRRKLGPGVIGTRRGFGYHLETGQTDGVA